MPANYYCLEASLSRLQRASFIDCIITIIRGVMYLSFSCEDLLSSYLCPDRSVRWSVVPS